MANSVSLSTDMNKLLFTDNSGTTEIPLSGDGVMIQMSGGDVSAEAANQALSGSGIIEPTKDFQWTVILNKNLACAYFIGVEDVDTTITVKDHKFSLTGKKLNIRRIGDSLIAVNK